VGPRRQRGAQRGPRGRPRSGAFPPRRPPRGHLCVLFPLVPGAATPISVRGDLREPGGEGRERLCGKGRGTAAAARDSGGERRGTPLPPRPSAAFRGARRGRGPPTPQDVSKMPHSATSTPRCLKPASGLHPSHLLICMMSTW
jgi:hypothetical protein